MIRIFSRVSAGKKLKKKSRVLHSSLILVFFDPQPELALASAVGKRTPRELVLREPAVRSSRRGVPPPPAGREGRTHVFSGSGEKKNMAGEATTAAVAAAVDDDKESSSGITIEILQQHFHQPLMAVAEELGVSLTVSDRVTDTTTPPDEPSLIFRVQDSLAIHRKRHIAHVRDLYF